MQDTRISRPRALTHEEYLVTLERPSGTQTRRISEIQVRKEREIDTKYHTAEEHEAATRIQRTYRGHRERRHLNGLTLDPSSRWLEVVREWKYRNATAPYGSSRSPNPDGRPRTPSDVAKLNWRRAGEIAEHAGNGDTRPVLEEGSELPTSAGRPRSKTESSMLLDLRYFLEMVDQKHRYGANLQVYHEEWKRSGADQNFFVWLDHGEGRRLDLPLMSREKLEREQIRYLSREERFDYLVRVDSDGLLRWEKNGELITTSAEYEDSTHGIVPKGTAETFLSSANEALPPHAYDPHTAYLSPADAHHAISPHDFHLPSLSPADAITSNANANATSSSSNPSTADESPFSDADAPPPTTRSTQHRTRKSRHLTPTTLLNALLRASVQPGTWIYVADTVGRLYVGIKASGAFQHASFLAGARIYSAGAIGIVAGRLVHLSPLSGHYRPTTRSFREFVARLDADGADLSALKVSKAYQVLLGMELYGKAKTEVKRMWKRGKEDEEGQGSLKLKDVGKRVGEEDGTDAIMADVRPEREEHRGLTGFFHDLNFPRHISK